MFALFAVFSQQATKVAQTAIDAQSIAIADARLSKNGALNTVGQEGTGIGRVMGDLQGKFFSLLEKCAYECKDWYEHMRAGFLYKVRQEGWDG